MNFYFPITFGVEILAAVTGLLVYNKYKQTATKYFIFFLVYLSVCDFSSMYVYQIKDGFFSFLEGTVFIRNYWWSTLFWKIGAIMFFSFYYYRVLISERFKKIVKFSGYFFLVISIVYILCNWDDYFIRFFPIIDVLGATIIFLCTTFYFFEILNSENILTFYKSINFYISAAIFIWWLIITPLEFYDIYNSRYDWNYIFLKRTIYLFANITMYLTFSFALIFCKPKIDKK